MEIITIKSKDGIYTGYFKEMPEVTAEGETKEELSKNLDEMLEEFKPILFEEGEKLHYKFMSVFFDLKKFNEKQLNVMNHKNKTNKNNETLSYSRLMNVFFKATSDIMRLFYETTMRNLL